MTEHSMKEIHRRLNREFFGGSLGKASFRVGRSKKMHGYFQAGSEPASFRMMSPGIRAIMKEEWMRVRITLSSFWCHILEEAERTMLHEMVHQWVHETFGKRKNGESRHDERFMRKAAEINAVKGDGYVSVKRCGKILEDGKPRPVVLFTLADGTTFGCSAGRIFSNRARGHIRKAKRLLDIVSVKEFRTRSPKAILLSDANRTKVRLSRHNFKLPWRIVKVDEQDDLLRLAVGRVRTEKYPPVP